MTLIDYRGFRLTAMSILPLFYSGIVYGKTRKSIYKESDNNTF